MGLHTVKFANDSLIDKFNAGFHYAKQFNRPVAIVGSDDIISEDFFIYAEKRIENGIDCVGLLDCFMVNLPTKEVYYWGGYKDEQESYLGVVSREGESIGAGRVFSTNFLEKINYSPFTALYEDRPDWCMDESNLAQLARVGCTVENTYLAKHGFRYWNVKSGKEINPFDAFKIYPNFIDVSDYQFRFWEYFDSLKVELKEKPSKKWRI